MDHCIAKPSLFQNISNENIHFNRIWYFALSEALVAYLLWTYTHLDGASVKIVNATTAKFKLTFKFQMIIIQLKFHDCGQKANGKRYVLYFARSAERYTSEIHVDKRNCSCYAFYRNERAQLWAYTQFDY